MARVAEILKAFVPMRVRRAVRALRGPSRDDFLQTKDDALYHTPKLVEAWQGVGLSCVVDVGANNGSFGIDIALRHPRLQVLAFEPTAQLAKIIREKTQRLANYELIEAAVSDTPGQAIFNVAGNWDWAPAHL